MAACGGTAEERAGHVVKPTGTIAFVAPDGVWTISADGTERRRLTGRVDVASCSPFRWSRDGTRLAFAATARGIGKERSSEHEELFVVRADGSHLRRLTSTSKAVLRVYNRPVGWSGDGRRIIVERNDDGPAGIFAVRANGLGERLLTRGPGDPVEAALSADGTRIVYLDRGGVYSTDVTGRDRHRIAGRGGFWAQQDFAPSPDGRRIAFLGASTTGKLELWVMDAGGSEPRNLSRTPTPETDFAWAPTGRTIAFTSRERPRGEFQVQIVDPDGSGTRRLTSTRGGNHSPAWSPDGKWIAFVSHRDGDAAVYVMRPDGTGQTRLTPKGQSAGCPAWSPAP